MGNPKSIEKISPKIYGSSDKSVTELVSLKNSVESLTEIDLYRLQLEELLEIAYPNQKEQKEKKTNFISDYKNPLKGSWVFFSWNKTLVHLLNRDDFYKIRTNRNRELITTEEQEKIKNFSIGIAGLSIGSNLASALSHLGARNFRLADFDKLATSNLNRVNATLLDLGKNKAVLTAERIFEIDPYSTVEIFDSGVNPNNLTEFLIGGKKLDITIDSIDDFEMKIRLRQLAKDQEIPVVMFTNLGDSTLIDIERYDKDPKLDIFNGLLADIPEEILTSEMTEENKKKFAAKLVGIENVPTRALESLLKMGTDLVGRPQLASTVVTSSGLATFIIKKIALDEECPSGRYLVHYPNAIFSSSKKDVYKNDSNRQELLKKLFSG